MTVYITRSRAHTIATGLLSRAIASFRVEPFVQLHRDGSASHGYRVALFSRLGNFEGWA